jgi:hypothetical protein
MYDHYMLLRLPVYLCGSFHEWEAYIEAVKRFGVLQQVTVNVRIPLKGNL